MAKLHAGMMVTRVRAKTAMVPLPLLVAGSLLAIVAGLGACSKSGVSEAAVESGGSPTECPGDNDGLSLSPGFCATVFADGVGHVRQMVIAADGTLYANSLDRESRSGEPAPKGGFILVMKDMNHDGRADSIRHFGATEDQGAIGGTGIGLYKNGLFAEEHDHILRYPLGPDGLPSGPAETVLSGLPTGGHTMRPFAIAPDGKMFVDVGSATNSCQEQDRTANSPGHQPCTEKLTRAGIWLYDANRIGQTFSADHRYASGIRNGEGMAWDADGRFFVTQHGRDQLGQNWRKYYTTEQGDNLPAEELVQLVKGGDYGWPECYYDGDQKRLVLAPEYGGDGGKTVGACKDRLPPVATFPAHWAPNALAIYHGAAFPPAYRGGAFIAFHGSWNRAAGKQGGYNVVFQPLRDGKAAGPWVVFAEGFTGPNRSPGKAAHRPTGVTEGPDGALYVSDDAGGRIWRITYHGKGADVVAAAVAPADGDTPPPAPSSFASDTPLPVPPGATAAQVTLGRSIFAGEARNGTCSGCHGEEGTGTAMGPALNSGTWAWGDGSLAALSTTIEKGIPQPKSHPDAMPPMGGATLSKADVAAVAAYVWAISHGKK